MLEWWKETLWLNISFVLEHFLVLYGELPFINLKIFEAPIEFSGLLFACLYQNFTYGNIVIKSSP